MRYELQPLHASEHGTLFRWQIIDTTTGHVAWRGTHKETGRQVVADFNRTPLYSETAVQDDISELCSRG